MKRTWVYPSDGSEAYEVIRGEYRNEVMASVRGDIEPFRSPDGVMIEGRKQWREHLKRTETGCAVKWRQFKSLTGQAHPLPLLRCLT